MKDAEWYSIHSKVDTAWEYYYSTHNPAASTLFRLWIEKEYGLTLPINSWEDNAEFVFESLEHKTQFMLRF